MNPGDRTVREAAQELGITRATVLKQIANGRLLAERVGPIYLITEAEIERYRRESLGRPGIKPSSTSTSEENTVW